MILKTLKSLLLAGALLAWSPVAEAKTLALLVGVADYNEPSGIHDLLGPRNDVTMIWRALKARGVDPNDITVLTDGLPQNATETIVNGAADRSPPTWCPPTSWARAIAPRTRTGPEPGVSLPWAIPVG